MQLQHGKTYVSRTGERVTVEACDEGEYKFEGPVWFYLPDGRVYPNVNNDADLIRSVRLRDCQPGDKLVWLADGTPVRFIAYVPELKDPIIVFVEGDSFVTQMTEDGFLPPFGTKPEVGFPEEGGVK